jgi:hypothetical protein
MLVELISFSRIAMPVLGLLIFLLCISALLKRRPVSLGGAKLIDAHTKEVYPLNKDNINAYITPSYNRSDNSIITSITTTGSKLLKSTDSGKIFIADMPGFDGNKVNLSNSLYDAISKRVDLILFVHSSVSAFNVTSNEYLEKLREYNGTVPVFLIHNIFDASFWKNKETRQNDVVRQSRNEYEEIKGKGFNIEPDYVSCINLGMVTDYVNKDENCLDSFMDELREEFLEFEAIEEKLYNKITTNIGKLRLERCLDRTAKLKTDLIALIAEHKTSLKQRKEDKDLFEKFLASIDKTAGLSSSEIEEIIDNVSNDANRSIFRSQAKSRVNKSMTTKECMACLREILTSFLANVDEKLTDKLFRQFNSKQHELVERINNSLNSAIKEVTLSEVTAETINNISDSSVKSFMKTSGWDWLADFTVGHSYKAETVRNSISNMERWYYGDEIEKDTTNLKMLLKEEIKRMAQLYLSQIRVDFDKQLNLIINSDELKTLSSLENLQTKLENIII